MGHKRDGFADEKSLVLPPGIKKAIQSDAIAKLLYVTDIGFYPNAEGHFVTRANGSEQNILIYCTDGEGSVSIENNRYPISKNQFFTIKANTPHSYSADEKNPWSIYWLHFEGEYAHLFEPFFNKRYDITEAKDARIQSRMQLFNEIFQNLEQSFDDSNIQYATLCLWHLLGSFFYIKQFREVNRYEQQDIIQVSIQYMKENLNKKVTLSDIAAKVKYSPSYFGHLFMQKTHFSPLEYFIQLKIQKACQLLIFTNMRIKDIANELNFYDQYHFTNMFIKYLGESPSTYKKRNKG